MNTGFKKSIAREVRQLTSRPIYIIMMAVVPLLCTFFFLNLLGPALPLKAPAAIVDLDQSSLSRQVSRSLNATELVDVQYKVESYADAMKLVREGKVFGFFIIPDQFERDAISGKTPTLEYYSNMTYFVPGTLSFKGFKTISVITAGGVVTAKLTTMGLTTDQVSPLVQPVNITAKGIGNPWTNYSYYLTPSFTFATLALLIMLMTAFSITTEIKYGTSVQWLETARGNIWVALAGKLLPQTFIFLAVGEAIVALLFGFNNFPMAGNIHWMILAMALFVPASQALGTFVSCILPNPRLSMSVISLIGILTFSFAGFSFPVEQMYGAVAIFSYIVPVRYLFLIYINVALNGFDVYYVRYCFVALLVFFYLPVLAAWNLRKAALKPVYVP